MPKLSRSALYQCLKRHGLSKIGRTAKCSSLTHASLAGPYSFEITANEVVFADGSSFGVPVFLAVEEVTKHLYAAVGKATPKNAAAFLALLVEEFPQKVRTVTTDASPIFTEYILMFNEDMAVGPHLFAVACRANRIVHTRTIPPFQKPIEPRKRPNAVEIR